VSSRYQCKEKVQETGQTEDAGGGIIMGGKRNDQGTGQGVVEADFLSENVWRALILTIAVAVLLFSIYCLSHGITIIFMHLYYFPIVLLAYRYRYRGFVLATLLSLAYVGLVYFYDVGQADVITGAWYRCIVFVGIAAVVAYLSERLAAAQLSQKEGLGTIQELQQFQESVITNANVWITVLAPDGTILVWNDAAEAISGYKRGEVLGNNRVWKHMYPEKEYREEVTRDIRRVIGRDTYLENFETEIRCADGTQKTIVWNTRGLQDDRGKVHSYVAIGRDITEQRKAEDALKKSETKYRQLVDVLNEGVWSIDTDSLTTFVNPRMAEMLGYSVDEMLGRSLFSFMDETGKKIAIENVKRRQRGIREQHDFEFLQKDGTRIYASLETAPITDKDGNYTGAIAGVQDISDRKRVEEALITSQALLNTTLDSIPDIIGIQNTDHTIIRYNRAGYEFLHLTPEEVHGRKCYELIGRTIPCDDCATGKALKSKKTEQSERYLPEYGIHLDCRSTPVLDKDGEIVFIVEQLRDITGRKRAEVALHESESFNRGLVENLPDYIIVYGPDGKILYVNPATARVLGYDADTLAGTSVLSYVAEEHRDGVISSMKIRHEGREVPAYETDIVAQDGHRRSVIVKGTPIRYHDSPAFLILLTDITERKRAEAELKSREELYKALIETTGTGYVIIDTDGKVLDANPEYVRLTGHHTPEEIIGRSVVEWTARYEVEKNAEAVKKCARDGYIRNLEIDYVDLNGKIIPVEINATVVETKGTPRILTLCRDITERKQAEEKLKFSNVLLSTQQEVSIDGILVIDESGKIISFNRRFFEIWGIPPDVVASRSDERALQSVIEKLANPEEFLARVKYLYANRDEKSREEIALKDGRVLDRYSAPMSGSDGKYYGRMWTFRDITEQKLVEEVIRESEERYRTLAEASPDQIFIVGRDDTMKYVNPASLKMFRLPYDQVVGTPRKNLFPPDIAEAQGILLKKIFETGESVKTEEKIQFGTQELWIDTSSVPLKDEAGHVTGVLGIARDITERKRAEDALRESEDRFRRAINATEEGLWEWDILTGEEFFSPRWCEIIGYSFDDPELLHTYNSWAERIHPDDSGRVNNALKNHLEKGTNYDVDYRHRHKSGEYRWQNSKGQAIFDESGKPVKMTGCISDITERKRVEVVLRESNEYLHMLIDFANAPIIVWDPEFRITRFNHAFESLTGRVEHEVIEQPLDILFPKESRDNSLILINKTLKGEHWETVEIPILTKEGSVRTVLWNSANILDPDGRIISTIAQGIDITERKRSDEEIQLLNATLEQRVRDRTQELEQATETIRASLEEKIVLLREVHHRVKNNLQILISLLNLQSRTISDPQVIAALKESTQRIRAMSMVHEKLYTGSDLAHIEFINYLSSLAKSQVSFYQLGPGKVTIETTGENIMLDINTAIPLGLVMNELVSNALKHAFPGDRKGTIRMHARETEDRLEITFADDGIGIPEGFDWKTTPSLGLRLVNILIEQLSGTIELKKGKGTTFIISVHRENA